MAQFAAFLVVGLLITSAYASSTAPTVSPTPTATPTPTPTKPNATTTKSTAVSFTSTQITANKTVSTVITASVHPSATSPPIHPTSTIIPTHTPTAIPTTRPKNGTTMPPTSTPNPTTNGFCPKCKVARESRAKWVAVAFAILFGVTTVVMTVLYCRQRKIYRELEGDSSLSRLI